MKIKSGAVEAVRKLKWDKTREWKKVVDRVLDLKERGKPIEYIVEKTRADVSIVRRILEDENFAEMRAKEVFERKVPVLQDILGLGLACLNTTLKEMANSDEVRKQYLGSVSDIHKLAATLKEVNTLIRLELGESTQNISLKQHTTHSYQDTRVAIQELKKIDPVFDYPELPSPPEPPKEPDAT